MICQRYTDFRGVFASSTPGTDADGFETFAVEDLRAGGFAALAVGLSLSTTLVAGFVVTANGNLPDAVPGVDEYDWYVSQPSGTSALLAVAENAAELPGDTMSGAIRLTGSAEGLAEMAGLTGSSATAFTAALADIFLGNVHVYCRRRSDGAIQWSDLRAIAEVTL